MLAPPYGGTFMPNLTKSIFAILSGLGLDIRLEPYKPIPRIIQSSS